MFDLIVRNANIQDGRRGVDIACIGGKIAEVGSALQGESAAEIDAKGRLVTPPFVDCHIHMDTALTLSETVNNESGELYEGINLWANLKPQLSADNVNAARSTSANGRLRRERSQSAAMSMCANSV